MKIFDLSTQPINRLFLTFVVTLMLIALAVMGIVMLGGEMFYENIF